MSLAIKDNEIDVVIGALRFNLTSFMNEYRPIFCQFHLIIVKDLDLKKELKIPEGFKHDVYKKPDIDRVVGSSTSILFSGYSCRYFGYLVSQKKYIISVDDDSLPARDNKGFLIDVVAQHITNLTTSATPFFFNTLYDPFSEGAYFVQSYLFNFRSRVKCVLSCGLWLNMVNHDAPTQALKLGQKNSRYVDAVITVPARALVPISGINITFDREVVGPDMLPTLRLAGEGKFKWETREDIWSGMCVKVVCDHLGLGVKSGLPYVRRNDRGDAIASLKKEWEGVKLMEEVIPFFQSVRLPRIATIAEECIVEVANAVKKKLGSVNPVFARAAKAMLDWAKLWKSVGPSSSSLKV